MPGYEATPPRFGNWSIKHKMQQNFRNFNKQIQALHKPYLFKEKEKMKKLVNQQIKKYKIM